MLTKELKIMNINELYSVYLVDYKDRLLIAIQCFREREFLELPS